MDPTQTVFASTSSIGGMPVTMIVALVAILALAVKEDMRRHRIPNALVLAGLIVGLGLAITIGGVGGGLRSLGGALVGLAVLMPFYLLRGMGAGDVKLMAAVGAFLGPLEVLIAAILSLVVGGALGIAFIAWRLFQSRGLAPGSITGMGQHAATTITVSLKQRFPYAIAIGLGTLLALGLRGQFDGLAGVVGWQ
jgi:prepilin peptidase CpaA